MYLREHELQVEKRWSELFALLTEDEVGHIRPSEEQALNEMEVERFFIKLLVFNERMKKRITNANKLKEQNNGKTSA